MGDAIDPKKPLSAGLKAGSPDLKPNKPVPTLPTSANVVGKGDLINGVFGGSKAQTGVVGQSDTFIGVSGDGPQVGVRGNSDAGDGVVGTGRRGVVGESPTFQGVFGKSRDNAGVVGESDKLHGVFGVCHNPNGGGLFGTNDRGGAGVIGASDAGTGVIGVSAAGIGVVGRGGSLAARFEGDIEVTGNIRMANADCAEDFAIEAGASCEPGTVMVLGDAGALRESRRAYDTRVAGVVSGAVDYQPAIVLDRQPSSMGRRQPIALMGKVYCKADARYGAIEVGDLLATSDTAGHAMKADPQRAFGAVIGKAIGALKDGMGSIPILVSLQ